MNNYFKECQTLEEVKKLYRQLAKDNHPDKGGDVATMQAINLQYTQAVKLIAKGYKGNNGSAFTDSEAEAEILQAEAYREAISKIINVEGIIIELSGTWLRITPLDVEQFWPLWFATFKPAGFLFAKTKKMFYFTTDSKPTKSKPQTKEYIKNKYGSQVISRTSYNYLAQ